MLPIVAEVAKNLGGVLLASRPQFDDMIDGLTFGIAAGTAYAAFETIVLYSSVFTSGDFRTTDGLASWAVVVVNLMVVKSLIYGTATGIAVAAFSGKGEGYDGFTRLVLRWTSASRSPPTSATGSASGCWPTCRSARRSGCCGAS